MGRTWLKPSRVREMSSLEAAWLAGFFDGEGSLVLRLGNGRHGANACALSIVNTNRSSLERVQTITACGSIVPKPVKKAKHKQTWMWHTNRQREVIDVLRQIEPYLTIKRPAALAHLASWRDVAAG